MAIQIVPHAPEWREAVLDFNRRLREGGSVWDFYADPEPEWIPPRPGQNVWREYYVAVEDGQVVRVAFALKPQDWLVNGQDQVVTDWQGPFSEGEIDHRIGGYELGPAIERMIEKSDRRESGRLPLVGQRVDLEVELALQDPVEQTGVAELLLRHRARGDARLDGRRPECPLPVMVSEQELGVA